MKELTTREAATLLGVMPNTVKKWCQRRRVKGARHRGGRWYVPATIQRPRDHRKKETPWCS